MKKLTKTALIILISVALSGILSYFVRILLANKLSLAQYGLFYAVYSLVFFFAPFRDLGLGEATVYFINKYLAKGDKNKIKGLFWMQFIPHMILAIFIICGFVLFKEYLVTSFFKDPESAFILDSLLVLFFLEAFFAPITSIFIAFQDYAVNYVIGVIKMVVILMSTWILFTFNFTNYMVAPITYVIGGAVSSAIVIIVLIKKYGHIFEAKTEINNDLIKEVMDYAIPITFSTAGGVILTYSDVIILTVMRGTEAVGLYNAAFPAINIILLAVTPLLAVIFPKISELYHAKKHKEIDSLVTQIYNNFLIFTLPLALIFAAYPKLIITVLFGTKFVGAENTLRVFALSFIFMVMRAINFGVVAGIGKARERSNILYIGAGANVLLDVLFIPKFGPAGAAVATGLGYIIMTILTTRLIKKEYPFKPDYSLIFRTIICGLGFFVSVTLLKYLINIQNAIAEAIIVVVVSGIAYIALLFLFRIFTKEKIRAFTKYLF